MERDSVRHAACIPTRPPAPTRLPAPRVVAPQPLPPTATPTGGTSELGGTGRYRRPLPSTQNLRRSPPPPPIQNSVQHSELLPPPPAVASTPPRSHSSLAAAALVASDIFHMGASTAHAASTAATMTPPKTPHPPRWITTVSGHPATAAPM